jgi:methionyl-tRNA synthetase
MEKFYVTTPIYYVNDRPHIGHAYATIVADALARYKKLLGYDVFLSTGTDENSQKTVDAAEKSGEDIQEYTDRLASIWKETWDRLGIDNPHFIRTTEERHKKVVEDFWNSAFKNGDIYKGKYEGLYCVGHEAFMKESDLVDDLCPEHKSKPQLVSEENYFFRLSNYTKPLLDFYESNSYFVVPENRFNEVKSFVRNGLEDISISRETRKWGIKVPDDPDHVIYVWFDALINYISIWGPEEWQKHPADVHVVGKDILRFHAVIWPAMLMSAGFALPKKVTASGFFTIDGIKISKSLGNAIDPIELIKVYGNDALRYFLLREIPYGDDGDFSETKMKDRYNADLANGLGNFAARVTTLGEKLGKVKLSEVFIDPEIESKIEETRKNVYLKIDSYKFNEALSQIWELISFGDDYVNRNKPWETNDKNIICNLIVILDNVAALVKPFLPDASDKITGCIVWQDSVLKINRGETLFPRIN